MVLTTHAGPITSPSANVVRNNIVNHIASAPRARGRRHHPGNDPPTKQWQA